MKLKSMVLLAALVAAMFSVTKAAAQNKEEGQLLPTIVSSASFAPVRRQTLLPDAPSHRFFDAHNVVSMSALTALLAVDGVTTQHLIQDYKFGEMNPIARPLARIIHDCEDTKSLFCYKHVVETWFAIAREAFACSTIARHSVCCSPIFLPSL